MAHHVIVDGAARNLLRNRNNLMSCYGSMITMFTEKATVLLGPFDAARCHSLALASQQWFTGAGCLIGTVSGGRTLNVQPNGMPAKFLSSRFSSTDSFQ
jgi:hypothetical protein